MYYIINSRKSQTERTGFMKIRWLGQAGLLFEKDNLKIMIDPYLSDSVKKINPKNYRCVPVKKEY